MWGSGSIVRSIVYYCDSNKLKGVNNIIYLVRHGLSELKISNSDPVLTDEGIRFSKKLPELVGESIGFIATVDKQRCIDTVKYLNASAILERFNCQEFNSFAFLKHVQSYRCSLICYGWKEREGIFKEFKINPKHRDDTYKFIYRVEFECGILNSIEEIPTGFEK